MRKDKLATNSCDISYEKKIIFKLLPIFLNHYYTYYYYYYYFGKTLIQFYQKSIKNKRSFKTCYLNKTRTKKWKNQKVITLIQITPITVSKSITSHLKLPPIPPPHLIRPNKTRTNKQTNQPTTKSPPAKIQAPIKISILGFPSPSSPIITIARNKSSRVAELSRMERRGGDAKNRSRDLSTVDKRTRDGSFVHPKKRKQTSIIGQVFGEGEIDRSS